LKDDSLVKPHIAM